jgi:2-phosphosulfolactate phosphatase
MKNTIEVCFSPALFPRFEDKEANVVVVDVLRATTAICTAFMNGVARIIPVGTLEEAQAMKNKGYMVAAERDGIVRDFADFGNSPFNFKREKIEGKEIVYSTTNGTQAIHIASTCHNVIIGAYTNISAVANWLIEQNRNVIILCAAWKDKFNLEDSVFAGALSEKLLAHPDFTTICDSTNASIDLWTMAKQDIIKYIDKAAQRSRLRNNGLDDVIEYCHQPDLTDIIPILKGDVLEKI